LIPDKNFILDVGGGGGGKKLKKKLVQNSGMPNCLLINKLLPNKKTHPYAPISCHPLPPGIVPPGIVLSCTV
jgi:hypothetical protein